MGSTLATDTVNVEIPPFPRVRRKILESEPNTCVFGDVGNNKRLSDADDVSCEITLKELRGRSKKKRKLLESVGMKIQNIGEDFQFNIKQEESDISVKKEESDIKLKKEEPEFEKPLSAWKKVPKKTKAKQKNKKRVRSSLESGFSVEEIAEQMCSGSENYTAQTSNINEMDSIVTGSDIDISGEMCIGSQTSAAKTSNIDDMHMSVAGGDLASISLAGDPSLSVVNEASFGYTQFSQPISPLAETVNFGENANMGFSHATSDSCPSVFELTKEGEIVKSITNHKLEEAIPVGWDLSSVVREGCKEYSSLTKPSSQLDCATTMQSPDKAIYSSPTQPSSQLDCDATMQSPDKAINGTTESKEFSGCTFDVKGKLSSDSDTPIHLKENIVGNFGILDTTFRDSYLPTNACNGGDPEYHGSAISEQHLVGKTEVPMSVGAGRVGECLSMTSPSARNGFSSAEVFKSQNGVHASYCFPRRLLSTRKAISPTSQERLRQAMDIDELYSSLGNARSSPKRAMVNICAGQDDMKSKNAHETSHPGPKSILKASLGTLGTPPRDSNGISSISSCTQKAVAFSQRQMQDIETLTMKLMKELKSMKDVVEESLYAREYSSPPKYTTDETRVAINKAAEVEETTKRWLSMMAKDCNRFCKIMRSSGKTAAAEKKKITFADEAGGVLCHVKIFAGDDTDSVSSPETQSVQQDMY